MQEYWGNLVSLYLMTVSCCLLCLKKKLVKKKINYHHNFSFDHLVPLFLDVIIIATV